MYWYGPHMGGWGWVFGLGSLVFWALLLAVVIIALVRVFGRGGQRPLAPHQGYASAPGPYGQPGPGHVAPAPEQVLAERFARGEIDEPEFRQRLATLRAAAPPGAAAGPPPSGAAPTSA